MKMEEKLDKIAEEYAEIFMRMEWKWKTPTFKGVPGKERIKKDIADKIGWLRDLNYDKYTSSGRIAVSKISKKLVKGKDSTYWGYRVSLDNKLIDEDEFDEILES